MLGGRSTTVPFNSEQVSYCTIKIAQKDEKVKNWPIINELAETLQLMSKNFNDSNSLKVL